MTDNKNALQNESNKNRFLINPLYQEKLTNSNRFVCYKEDKRPYNAITRYRADVTNKMNYTTFDNACNSVRKSPDFEGIGFVLGYDKTSDLNYCGLDIDNCIDDNGVISGQAQELIDLLDTYTEISKSGKGIHCIFIAHKQGGICKNDKLDFCKCLELYDNGRYFALTGNIIRNKDIENRQEQCDIIYDKYFKCKELPKIKINISDNQKTLSKEKIKKYYDFINKIIAKGKDKVFIDLWQGKRSTKNDESANDITLFIKLAHYTNCDALLIEKLAFLSPFYKTKVADEKAKRNQKGIYKWERKDYLRTSILKAIAIYQNRKNERG